LFQNLIHLQKKNNTKEDLYHLNFITLNSNSTIRKFIDNILIQNQIETKQLKIIMQLNSIEGIKTAVSLGLGAAFVSSSAIEKEIELKTIEILKIENIRITRTVINN
jgi:DNA-binding transcriptional LysR family regulator